ncbi:diguanylate cyclase domain-containing protein [Shewanella halotolerans]|uniref:diguanylate cyclase domain-containing protein n=1 Tax=Shewanella halotolerans TaxID=2864204 RepID=UPI001C658CBE|nr:diguanylate cyclase [Shewanella halotolerans]QYJ91176.1 diguanylate cyclase [Shewanella halotolerans]
MSIQKNLLGLLTLLFLFVFANIFMAYFLEQKSEQKLRWVNHTHTLLSYSDKLLLAVANAETGQRGYLLTGQKHYLQPYHLSLHTINDLLKQITLLTRDNLKQQQLLARLSTEIERKIAELKESIALFEKDPMAAMALVRSDVGQEYMDNIRHYLDEFNREEQRLLELRIADFTSVRGDIKTIFIIEIIVALFLALAIFVLIRKGLFAPLSKLIEATKRMEAGERQHLTDFLPNNEIGYLMSSFYKMSEVVFQKHQQLHKQAHLDELTGVNNRVCLFKDLSDAIEQAQCKETILALVFLDIDNFKQINDEHGHQCGDELLKALGIRLTQSLRRSDGIYRYGGDEFLILLNDLSSVEEVHKTLAGVVDKMRGSFSYQGEEHPLHFSLGAALMPQDSQDSETLIRYADIAMYVSKREGLQRLVYFEPKMLEDNSIA